jgi:4-amino-4-deoxy-L-arabinose transferase-like glycosyltransferase
VNRESTIENRRVVKAILIFLAGFALYFLSRSPGLDEIDSVNFAMGVREFDIWMHQPQPPGYPLYIALGKLGVALFGMSPELSLHVVSAIGGAIFLTSWFLIIRRQFDECLAWWLTSCLAITPVVWMAATKVLTDSLAAGFLSAEILWALCFVRSANSRSVLGMSIFGAAAAGARPQLLAVVLVIWATAIWWRHAPVKTWLPGIIILIAGCLLWLLPMWYSQWLLDPGTPLWQVYPKLIYGQWQWRFDKPDVYIGAGDWSPRYLATRFAFHFLGWFGFGFGLLASPAAFVAGVIVLSVGVIGYFARRRETTDVAFWKFHLPWAAVHCVIIFNCLPPTQRYYLVIYPLLLVLLLRGFLRMPAPWNWSVIALPALLLSIAAPLAIANHRDDAPPVRLVRYLEKLHPESEWSRVVLLFSNRTQRHAQWYGPGFKTIPLHRIPSTDALPDLTKDAVAIYTDDDQFPLPRGWRRVLVTEFSRNWVIYMKSHDVKLFRIEQS